MQWPTIEKQISDALGKPFHSVHQRAVGGGSINQAYRLEGEQHSYFVKLNHSSRLAMFEAEAEGLLAIHKTNTIQVPQPICWGVAGDNAYIAMEYIPQGGSRGDHVALGRQLAAMHRVTAEQYGWHRNNTIGSTQQQNGWRDDWVEFWQQQRLGFQLQMAHQNGYGRELNSLGEQLLVALPQLLAGYQPAASLLHGDLWSGNYGFDDQGQPLIFDPALYYGDRETDLAMTELFGGFSPDFYSAYREAYPLDDGYALRKTLYNLYHILNHVNLFGSGYLGQARRMLEMLLSEVK